jgi:transcriptional regulator with XRE-family HTH domain
MPASPMQSGTQGESGPVAAKINALFATRLRPVSDHQHHRDLATSGDRNAPRRMVEYSVSMVARAIGSTDSYVHQLRHGKKDNPSLKLVQRLANFFKVDVTYLAKDDVPVDHLPRYLLDQPSVADRLNTLFERVRPAPGALPYTDAEVADAIGVTADQIRSIRQGIEDDPGVRLLRSLAAFFRVPAEYLTGTDPALVARVEEQLAFLAEWLPIAARGGLSSPKLDGDSSLRMMTSIFRYVRQQLADQPDSRARGDVSSGEQQL